MKESLIAVSKFLSQDTKQIFLIKRRTVPRSILHTLVAELHYNRKRYDALGMGGGVVWKQYTVHITQRCHLLCKQQNVTTRY